MYPTIDIKNLKDYLTENPLITFNKEVYKRYTPITNVIQSHQFKSLDGSEYICDDFCSNDLIKNSYITEISLYTKDEESFLLIDDVTSIEILIVSNNTTSILHKYSGLTLKAILVVTKNLNEHMINLPLNKFLFVNKFVQFGFKLKIIVNLKKFNINLFALTKYVKMLEAKEIKEFNMTSQVRLIKHVLDEIFAIEKGLNVITLTPNNVQACLIIFTFPKNMSDVNATLKIGDYEHQINKYCSNRHFTGLNNDPNIMIFDIYQNVNELYNNQPTGNIFLDGKVTLTFDSDKIGHLVVGYILLDIIKYENSKISFFDMQTKLVNELNTTKPNSIKYITIHNK